jgi:hypothetical protein
MAANLHLVLGAVITLFAVFMIALGYAQWSTWGMEVYRSGK